MKIVFMGTPDFAATCLKALLKTGTVAAVVSQPDKPVGRKALLVPTPVKEAACEAGVPVLQPQKMRDPEFLDALRAYAPDLIVVAAFGRIIPGEILSLPRLGCVNVHASLLPKYRGAAPIQWALLDGEETTGVTLMQMDEGLDTGAMLAVREVPITAEDTGGSLFEKIAAAGAALLVEKLPEIEAGSLQAVPQPEESPTAYARMIKKEDGRIDWSLDAAAIERKIRAMDPWPSAFTTLGGKTCKIWKARVAEETNAEEYAIIADNDGAVLSAGENGLFVQTGNGILQILELQLEGKKRMEAGEFLRGRPLETGTQFQ